MTSSPSGRGSFQLKIEFSGINGCDALRLNSVSSTFYGDDSVGEKAAAYLGTVDVTRLVAVVAFAVFAVAVATRTQGRRLCLVLHLFLVFRVIVVALCRLHGGVLVALHATHKHVRSVFVIFLSGP